MSEHNHAHPVTRAGFRFLVFSLFEMIAGIVTANSALATSAIHDFLDGISMRLTGRFDERWEMSADHSLYCWGRGSLEITIALFIPVISSLGLLIEPRESISSWALLIVVIVGGISLSLNLISLIQTWRHKGKLHTGYLAHFIQDAIGSIIVIVVSLWAYGADNPQIVWRGSLVIIVSTFVLGLGSAIHTLVKIAHREINHDHEHEPPKFHQYHAQGAAS
jgi:Co/Zn/Cd efflux system component